MTSIVHRVKLFLLLAKTVLQQGTQFTLWVIKKWSSVSVCLSFDLSTHMISAHNCSTLHDQATYCFYLMSVKGERVKMGLKGVEFKINGIYLCFGYRIDLL